MVNLVFIVFTLLSVCTVDCFLFGRCTQDPDNLEGGHINNHDVMLSDYTVDISCKNGSIYWNYPRGSIRLHFRNMAAGNDFQMCMKDNLGADNMIFTDETAGRNVKLDPFSRDEDNEICLKSVRQEVTLLMYSPSTYYMQEFAYRIVGITH